MASTQGQPGRRTFVAAVTALVAAFAASAAPVPLFTTYRAEDGIPTAAIALSVAAYFAGTITALLLLGRLADHLGRRPIAIAALISLAAGCGVLMTVHDTPALLTGRLLMGLGAGLASSALTALIVDAAPTRPAWMASVASSQAPLLGLTLGAIGSGALVQYGPAPRILTYLIMVISLASCVLLIVLSRETAHRRPGAWHSLRPRLVVPNDSRRLLPVAGLILLATWATGASYQAFVPSLLTDQLGTSNALLVGLVFSSYMTASILGAPVGGRLTPATAQRTGMSGFLIGMILLLISLGVGAMAIFLIASAIAGAGQGVAMNGSIRALLHGSTASNRSAVFATIYLISYAGAAIPSLIAGQLSEIVNLSTIFAGYGVLAVLATTITLIVARNPRTRRD